MMVIDADMREKVAQGQDQADLDKKKHTKIKNRKGNVIHRHHIHR